MKKSIVIVVIAILLVSAVLFIPAYAETIKTPFGEMKVSIDIYYKDGSKKPLTIAGNLFTVLNPMAIYYDGDEVDYIQYKIWVKAYGSFSDCELEYMNAKVGYAIYERDGGSYPNDPPLHMYTISGQHQDSGGYMIIPINTGSGESGWFEIFNLRVEETDVFRNAYTDAVDYKLTLFMDGIFNYRGLSPGYIGPWETTTGVPILSNDVYFSITSDGQPPPPNLLTVISGPENNNVVSVVGVGQKTSANGVAVFEVENGIYSITITHDGYDPYQIFDYLVEGPTTVGPIDLTGNTGPIYAITVLTMPGADYIDVEGMFNDYFVTDCDDIGMGIFIVPEAGQYKCTAGWDDLNPSEKSKFAHPTDSMPSIQILIYWTLTTIVSQHYTMEHIDMGSNYNHGGYYLGIK